MKTLSFFMLWLATFALLQNRDGERWWSHVKFLASDELRGRVMAIYILIFLGGTSIGAVIAGLACEHWGPRWTLGLAALMSAAAAVVTVRVRAPADLESQPAA